jgi:hypothetical protein
MTDSMGCQAESHKVYIILASIIQTTEPRDEIDLFLVCAFQMVNRTHCMPRAFLLDGPRAHATLIAAFWIFHTELQQIMRFRLRLRCLPVAKKVLWYLLARVPYDHELMEKGRDGHYGTESIHGLLDDATTICGQATFL